MSVLGGDEGIEDEAGVAVDEREEVEDVPQREVDELVDVVGEEAIEDCKDSWKELHKNRNKCITVGLNTIMIILYLFVK